MSQNQQDFIHSTITSLSAKPGRYYSGDSLAARLENYLIENGIKEIGDNSNNQIREKYAITRSDGSWDLRPASLEIGIAARASRTRDVCRLTEEGIMLLHNYEQRRMTRLMTGSREMRVKLRITMDSLPDLGFMEGEEFEKWKKISEESRPPMETFHGFLVPPYFIYDNYFDGMNFNHAIDMNAWKKMRRLSL